jgi:hypothetical protein
LADLVLDRVRSRAAAPRYPTPLSWLDAEPRYVQHPTRGRIPFEVRDYQREVLAAYNEPRRIIVKSRQIGFTQTFGMEAYWKARYGGRPLILGVAQREENAAEFIRVVREQCDDGDLVRDNALSLKFRNGNRIKAQAATKNPGRGYPASDIYLDEFGFAPWDLKVWQSIAPAVSTGGTVTVYSSPNGRANAFYNIWAGRFGGSDWWRRSYSWRVLWDEAWAEVKRRTMTREGFAEEYEAEAGFLSTGGVLFDAEDVEACFVPGCETPRLPDRMYRLYCDPAGSGKDATALQVWDVTAKPYTLACSDRWITGKFAKLYRRAAELVEAYGCDVMTVERNGLGAPIIEELADTLLPLECRVDEYLTDHKTKEAARTALKMLLEAREIRYSDEQLKAEALVWQEDDKDQVTDSVMTASFMALRMREERGDDVEDWTGLV